MKVQKSFSKPSGTSSSEPGKLYLVATPIGNLEDMTFRAVRILKEVDWVAAEDTRQTRKLLNHYDIAAKTTSYHEHNKHESGAGIIKKLENGESVALVSDAGIPAISDPGYELVRSAIAGGIAVIPIPGANAALSALIVSGLPTDRFSYIGFLPRTKNKLAESLTALKNREETMIFYESPHRVEKTLVQLLDIWGDRQVVLARELTKKFEGIARGAVSQMLVWLEQNPPRGEYCLVVEGSKSPGNGIQSEFNWAKLTLAEHVNYYFKQSGDRKDAMKKVAADRSLSKRDIYNALLPGQEKNPVH